ncbi:MAG: molybdopterin-dependent oxidoreductase [Desulfobacteraceae bacterium]|nr:molybdopterin-dependent oxidoreductase [Desulfobacteraceae bacterium]
MTAITTVCARDCYDSCSLQAIANAAGEIVSLKGDPRHPITQGFACPRGIADLRRLTTGRIAHPYIRAKGGFRRVGWDEALDRTAEHLQSTLDDRGPASALLLDYAGNMGLLSSIFPRRLWSAVGATFTDGGICSRAGAEGIRLHYGDAFGMDPLRLSSRDLAVFWGFNAAVSAPHLWYRVRKARATRGTRIVVVDSRRSETSRRADRFVQPAPGTDVALVYGLVNRLIRSGRADTAFLRNWSEGYEHLRGEAMRWNPDRVAERTGVRPGELAGLADAYAESEQPATLIGIGLQKNNHGGDQARAVSLVPAVLGQHRGFYYSRGAAHPVDLRYLAGTSQADVPPPTVSQVGLAGSMDAGTYGLVFVSCMNPAVTMPNQRIFRRGLERPDLTCIVCDSHWTETARIADIVLPALTYLEKEDLVLPWGHDFLQRSRRVAAPATEGRCETEIMAALSGRLRRTEPWLYEDPWEALRTATLPAVKEGDWDALLAGERIPMVAKPDNVYPTPSGKIELSAAAAPRYGLAALPLAAEQPSTDDRERFVLLNSASRRYTSTQFQEVYGPIPPEVVVNPKDAAGCGVREGDTVVLANRRGRIRLRAKIADSVPEGVLWSPRQCLDLDGKPQNLLTSSRPQAVGNGSRFNATRVNLLPGSAGMREPIDGSNPASDSRVGTGGEPP